MPGRLTGADALAHPLRQRLVAALKATPGLRIADLTFLTSACHNTVEYHLALLRRRGLLESRKAPGEPWGRWYVRNDKRPATPIRPRGPSRRIYDHLLAVGVATATQLGRALDLHPSHVTYWLRKLEQGGVLATYRRGRSRVACLATEPAGPLPGPGTSTGKQKLPAWPEWLAQPAETVAPPLQADQGTDA